MIGSINCVSTTLFFNIFTRTSKLMSMLSATHCQGHNWENMLIQPDQLRFIIDKLGMNCFVLVLRLSDFSEIHISEYIFFWKSYQKFKLKQASIFNVYTKEEWFFVISYNFWSMEYSVDCLLCDDLISNVTSLKQSEFSSLTSIPCIIKLSK